MPLNVHRLLSVHSSIVYNSMHHILTQVIYIEEAKKKQKTPPEPTHAITAQCSL